MKTIFTLLLATIFSFTASADDESLLTITIAQANAEVLVNGRVYRPGPDRTVTIHDIRPGRHRLEVYQRRGHGNNHQDRRRSNLLYASTISIRPFHHVDVMINRFGKALIDEQVRGDRYDDADDHYGNADAAMRDQDFLALKDQVQRQWSDNNRMTTLRIALERNRFTTDQVKQLLQLLSFESNRLEIAKLAYRNTTDRHFYYQLFDVFVYQSNRDELAKYISEYRF